VAGGATKSLVKRLLRRVGETDQVRLTRSLRMRGAHYGLCQIYSNESWHYELRPEATSRGCPRMYADPTHDPRMQR
jgi:hypothetical protein